MWTLLFILFSFRTALSSVPRPTNVTFTSVNLRNILQWSPAHNSPAHTKYTVRYAIYGDSVQTSKGKSLHWRPVLHCTEITRNWCDLSVETSNLEDRYYAQVRTVSGKNHSKGEADLFDPKINTEIGPPHVSVEIQDKYAVITIEGPMRYLPYNHTSEVPMATLFPQITYNLSVHNTRSGQFHHFHLIRKQFKYYITDHGVEYCFSAKTQMVFMPNKHLSSAWHCLTTPKDSLIDQLRRIIVGIVVPIVLLGMLIAGGHGLYKYLLGKDQNNPYILNPPTFLPPPLPLLPDNVNFIVISPLKDGKLLGFGKNKLYPEWAEAQSPALQRPETPRLCDVLCDDSVDYGFVTNNAGNTEKAEKVDVEQCKVDEEKESYKRKEWQIEAESSGGTYPSQNSFLQTSLLNPMLLIPTEENHRSLSLHENPETGSLQLQFNNENNSSNVVEAQNVENSTGYMSQRAPVEPTNQPDDLPDDYCVVGVDAEQEEDDMESLLINWDPATQKLIIPGLDLGLGQSEVESPFTNLGTVFVRQPSEDEALLGAERAGSGQWDAEDFKTKWDLVLSGD